MKNTTITGIAALFITMSLLAASCAKEKATELAKSQAQSASVKNPLLSGKFYNPYSYGYITGRILPIEAKPSIVLHSAGEDIVLHIDENGSLGKSRVPSGIYTLSINPGNNAYGGYVINDLSITDNGVTDIGTIILQLLNPGGDGISGN